MSLASGKGAAVGKGAPYGPAEAHGLGEGQVRNAPRKFVATHHRALHVDERPADPTQITPKVDGELWFAWNRGASVGLASANGRVLDRAILVVEAFEKGLGVRCGDGEIVTSELFAVSKGGCPRVGDRVARARPRR